MKVLIDNSNLFAGGGIQVAISFINDLLLVNDSTEYFIIQSENCGKQVDVLSFDKRFKFFSLSEESIGSIRKRRTEVKRIEEEVKPDVIFTVFGPSYHKSNFPKIVGFAIPHILYPESPFFDKISFLEKLKLFFLNGLKSYAFKRNANALIFESEDANNIFSKKINKCIPCYTVSNTLNSVFNDREKWKQVVFKKSQLDILYLTANYPHKNLSIIPAVIDEITLRSPNLEFKFNLSVTRDDMGFDSIYDKYINYLGRVDINCVPSLYQQMDILFMPTLLEVFSTSYLEAMFMKIPIVASDMSFARDVCNDAALFCDPLDAKAYAQNILALYSSKELRNDLIQKGEVNLKRFGSSMDRTLKYLEILKKHAK